MDLADQIDDYICTFEGIGDLTADMLAMFIFVWAVMALFLIWLCKFLYNKYVDKTNNNNNTNKSATTITNKLSSDIISSSSGSVLNREKRQTSEPRELSASKDVKELASKPIGGSLRGAATRGRPGAIGGAIPAPTVRKRLTTRMSPGPEIRTKSRPISPPSNVVGPETTSVTWTSKVFCWLYSDLVIVNELFATWVEALNNSTSKLAEDYGVSIEIVRVLPDSPPPNLQNIFCDSEEQDPSKMIISCDCDATPVLQIRAVRSKTGKMETHHYKATISRFRGRLSAPMSYNTLKGEMRVEGYPDIRIALNSVGAVKPMDQDEQQLQDTITQILTSAFRDTVYPIDFSIYATCPRAPDTPQPENPVMFMPYNTDNYPLNEDMMMYNMDQYDSISSAKAPKTNVRRLLVKIVKGEGLLKAKDPYCVVEMDEPPQKNQTGARQGTDPYWDEHFLFDLSPQSAELLFEVYDRPINPRDSPKFLGLGLVGIDELNVGPSSSQILTLQPRPYENEIVNGAIMVEFVFIERAELPPTNGPRPYKLKEALKIDTPMINEHLRNGSDLADAAVKAIQDGALGATVNGQQPSKSTLIIHSVQRVELNKDGQIEMNENVDETIDTDQNNSTKSQDVTDNEVNSSPNQQIVTKENDLIEKNNLVTLETEKFIVDNEKGNNSSALANGGIENESFGRPGAQSSPQQSNGHSSGLTLNHSASGSTLAAHQQQHQQQQQQNNSIAAAAATSNDERGRSKKRDFFGTIKRRFGKSRTRSKSIDHGMIPIDVDNLNGSNSRSLSLDRRAAKLAADSKPSGGGMSGTGASVNLHNNTLSPGPRILVPTFDQSRRSSLSESSAISGFSSTSTKTFIHEASALVLETIENGVKRHFLVPMAIAQRPRWRRKGTKLHIYNDHTFVAKHLSGSNLVCSICTKSIPRRPGKQGYECRDCQLICHKQCHIRAPQACPNPTILSMELSKLNMAAFDRSIRKI